MIRQRIHRKKGVTLTEMLVVLAIIGLLSTIAVPVYVSRIEDARRATAITECREIADAQTACLALHGFYVPIQVLDDVVEVQGVSSSQDDDTIENEPLSSINLIDPYVPLQPLPTQLDLTDEDTNTRVNNVRFRWQGPFMRFKRVHIGSAASDDPADLNSAGVAVYHDHPLDPWGQPYRFYSAVGIIGSNSLSTSINSFNSNNFSDGRLTTQDDRFDRYAIISFGRDGDSDNQTNADDDVIIYFGFVAHESQINLF